MQLETSEGRDWLAMQYVLAELPDDQRTAFEDAMLDDVSLCEFVVGATRLTAGLTRALAAEAKGARPVVKRRAMSSQVSIFVAGIVLVAFLMVVVRSQFGSLNQSVTLDDSETADAFVNFLADDEASLSLADVADDTDSTDSLSDLVAPEWLLTAVELENNGSPETSAEDSDVY